MTDAGSLHAVAARGLLPRLVGRLSEQTPDPGQFALGGELPLVGDLYSAAVRGHAGGVLRLVPRPSRTVADCRTRVWADLHLDRASIKCAEDELRQLWATEQKIVRRADKKRVWTRVEISCTTLSAVGTVGLACAAALPAIGAGAALLAFAGWGIVRWQTPRPALNLGGASMFIEAQRRLAWMRPDIPQRS